MHERCQVDTDECNEGAEVDQFRSLLISQQERTYQRNRANDQDVVARHLMTRIDRSEYLRGKRVTPTHAVHEPGCAELRGNCGSHICHQQRCVKQLKQEGTAHPRCHVHERCIDHVCGKRLARSPCQLSHIDLKH